MDLTKKRKIDENGGLFATAGDGASPPSHLNPDDARKIIEEFTKEQLIDILKIAAVHHRDVLDTVRSIADADPSKRKLFVRGLSGDTTTEKLRAIFSSYGDLDEAIVITDKNTGKSKGYGFVTFRHIDGASLALKDPSKRIDGRMTVTQLASVGHSGANVNNAVDVSLRKIYVGNVPYEISSERLLDHFSMYGEVEEGPLGFDKQPGKTRGFAFFVYRTEEGARASLVDPMKVIDGHQVNCKLAVDGKKGKPGGPNVGGIQGPTGMGGDVGGDRLPPGSMLNPNYGYGVYAGGQPGLAHQNSHLNSPMPSAIGGQGFGNQGQMMSGGYVGGPGNSYAGSQFGGSGDYGGLGSGGSAMSSMYRLPPGSIGLPSVGQQDGGNYGSLSAAYQTQLQQQATGPRVPPGGMYQGIPPYY